MALRLTGGRDQALVAMVIEEARQAADQKDGWVGRTAVQKLLYFIRRAGVPMDYRFELYHYGPYCDDLTRDVQFLQFDGVLADRSRTERYSDYETGPALEELIGGHRDELEQHRDAIRRTVQALVPLSPEQLELLATLDYLYRWEKATGSEPRKEAVLQRLEKVKPGKFTPERAGQVYDTMLEAGLFA